MLTYQGEENGVALIGEEGGGRSGESLNLPHARALCTLCLPGRPQVLQNGPRAGRGVHPWTLGMEKVKLREAEALAQHHPAPRNGAKGLPRQPELKTFHWHLPLRPPLSAQAPAEGSGTSARISFPESPSLVSLLGQHVQPELPKSCSAG